MSITRTADTATIWLTNGAPDRMVWGGERWTVIDTPTLLEDLDWARITHPPAVNGWRFTARASDQSLVFDVVPDGKGWSVLHVWG